MEKIIDISELIPDNENANKGSEFGNSLIEKSLRKFGAGRSILLDKNNKIVAGNKTIENAASIGLNNVIIVETDGTKLVAVKRNDIDLNTKEGREMALADNASAKANITWDDEVIEQLNEKFEIDTKGWGVECANIVLFDDLLSKSDQRGGFMTDGAKLTIGNFTHFYKKNEIGFDEINKLGQLLLDSDLNKVNDIICRILNEFTL